MLCFLCACICRVVGSTDDVTFFGQAVLWIVCLEEEEAAALFGSSGLRGDGRHRTGEAYRGS